MTDPEFSQRLLKLLEYWPKCGTNDIELLKYGRVFWLNKEGGQKTLLVIGRHKDDNGNLERLARKSDVILELKGIAGPTALIRNIKKSKNIENLILKIPKKIMMAELKLDRAKNSREIINTAAFLTGYYAVKARGKKVNISIKLI